jgi:hypothetical protein
MKREPTGDVRPEARPAARPPKRGINCDTFRQLEGITPEIVADMSYCLHGDGYDRVNKKTLAFMGRHNLRWVSLYGNNVELGR